MSSKMRYDTWDAPLSADTHTGTAAWFEPQTAGGNWIAIVIPHRGTAAGGEIRVVTDVNAFHRTFSGGSVDLDHTELMHAIETGIPTQLRHALEAVELPDNWYGHPLDVRYAAYMDAEESP